MRWRFIVQYNVHHKQEVAFIATNALTHLFPEALDLALFKAAGAQQNNGARIGEERFVVALLFDLGHGI